MQLRPMAIMAPRAVAPGSITPSASLPRSSRETRSARNTAASAGIKKALHRVHEVNTACKLSRVYKPG